MIDGMVVAAYVAAALGAAGGRAVDRSLDQGLTALTGAIARRLGRRALDDLDRNPHSMAARRQLADAVERAASADAEFARELAELRDQLDRMNGRTIINTATHGSRIVTGGDGMTAGDDIHNTTYDSPAPGDLSGAPLWSRVLIWIGTTVGVIGWAIAGIAIAQHTPGHMNDATNGFVVFMIGVGIALVGQYGASTSTPRRRR
ncbi:hypothetical protein [Nocardia beijingensis]